MNEVSRMRLMITNDDGYSATGIQTLKDVLRSAGHEVVVIAPYSEQSAKSHGMTFGRPLLTKQVEPGVYWIDGTPGDCVAVGLEGILLENPPDLVISGINNGLNVGQDINYSGTVAAAFEAAQIGYRSLAVSMEYLSNPDSPEARESFGRVARFVAGVLANLHNLPWPGWSVLNINHPRTVAKGVRASEAHLTAIFAREVRRIDIGGTGVRGDCLWVLGGQLNTEFRNQEDDVCRISQGYATLSFLNSARGLPANTSGLRELASTLEQ